MNFLNQNTLVRNYLFQNKHMCRGLLPENNSSIKAFPLKSETPQSITSYEGFSKINDN